MDGVIPFSQSRSQIREVFSTDAREGHQLAPGNILVSHTDLVNIFRSRPQKYKPAKIRGKPLQLAQADNISLSENS